jgi:hypothetical protein
VVPYLGMPCDSATEFFIFLFLSIMMECPLLHLIKYLDIVCYKPSYAIGLSCRTYLWIYRCCGVFLLFVAVEVLWECLQKTMLSQKIAF